MVNDFIVPPSPPSNILKSMKTCFNFKFFKIDFLRHLYIYDILQFYNFSKFYVTHINELVDWAAVNSSSRNLFVGSTRISINPYEVENNGHPSYTQYTIYVYRTDCIRQSIEDRYFGSIKIKLSVVRSGFLCHRQNIYSIHHNYIVAVIIASACN